MSLVPFLVELLAAVQALYKRIKVFIIPCDCSSHTFAKLVLTLVLLVRCCFFVLLVCSGDQHQLVIPVGVFSVFSDEVDPLAQIGNA